MSEVKIHKISYRGWDNCVHITNDIVELIVTADVGPRIIRYGFIGQENEMCEIESTVGLKGADDWRIYGGHRLWHSPEEKNRTYEPDNLPVNWVNIQNGIMTAQDIEPNTKIKKEMEITLSPDNSGVHILHRLTNSGLWPVELSAWSISAMATGGKEVIPLRGKETGLLPNRIMALWPYTKLTDHRIIFGDKYIILRQDTDVRQPFKIGISNENGWAAYFNHNHLFLKYYSHENNAGYPDFGVSYETYTNEYMLEMETLSPLTLLEPSAFVEHVERWELFDDTPYPSDDEIEIDKLLADKINPAKFNAPQ